MAPGGSKGIGIMQGRLSNKPGKPLQSFPWNTWKDEFFRASDVGFNLIEWLVDGENDNDNPIFSAEGRNQIDSLKAQYNIGVKSVCAHTFIDGRLLGQNVAGKKARNLLKNLLDCSAKAGIEYLVLPAMDQMSLKDPHTQDRMHALLEDVLNGSDTCIILEGDLPGSDLYGFVERVKSEKIGVLYDLGNANAMGFDINSDIKLLKNFIFEIHMKDRFSNNGPSHRLGSCDTPFGSAISTLEGISWTGPIILETPIFNDWLKEAQYNLAFTQNIWHLERVES